MSQDVERVYTVNLGKVLLSPDNQRAKRAVNMIKEFARHHMKIEQVKLEEDVSHLLWARGIRHPPRKIRVRMTKTDEGYVLVSIYEGEEESIKEEEKKVESEPEPATKPEPKAEPEPATKPEPTTKPEPKAEPEPATKPEPKTEPEPATKPESKSEPAAKLDDAPEFFKKKDEEKKPKSKSKD